MDPPSRILLQTVQCFDGEINCLGAFEALFVHIGFVIFDNRGDGVFPAFTFFGVKPDDLAALVEEKNNALGIAGVPGLAVLVRPFHINLFEDFLVGG